jgi:guanine deaminase
MIVHGLLLIDPCCPPTPGWVRISDGRIVELELTGDRPPDDEIQLGGDGRLICPGFIDAHTHPPQIDCVGADGLELLAWLDRVVFPAEIWWGKGAAGSVMRRAMREMLTQGTLSFAGYLTSQGVAAREAISQLEREPKLRAIVGRVAMDRNAPDELIEEDRARSRQSSPASVAMPASAVGARVAISVNPRFAPACSEELLAEIGWFIKDHPGVTVQTHLAEAKAECDLVKKLFPDDPSYTAVYDRFGLLTDRTLLAHCVHLDEAQWELIAHRQCVVVHCPSANLFLKSGLFDLDAATEHGMTLALGSDIAAGPDVAMPCVARAMIEIAKVRKQTVAPNASIPTPALAWQLITLGNADALGWADSGRLEVGAWADLLILQPRQTWFDEHLIGRLLYNWSEKLIESRVIAGKLADPATI